MVEEKNFKGILKASKVDFLKEFDKKNEVSISFRNSEGTYPYFVLEICCSWGKSKSCLYNFPGSYDIGVLTNIQDINASKLELIILSAEEILRACGMSALVITVNSGFDYEGKLLELNFSKETTTGNPHSGNLVRFFVKEI